MNKSYKYALTTTFMLISCIAFSQMRNVYIDSTLPENKITKISFYSPSSGYVAFRNWIGFTSDSGNTFTKKFITINNVDYNNYSVNLTFGFGINGVKAFNKDTLIAYGDYGFVPAILYSVNGGNSFKLVFQSLYNPMQFNSGITDMVFPENNNVGYAIDADRVLKSSDKGLNWTVIRNDPGSFFTNIEAPDNNNVFVFSSEYLSNKLIRTSNAGSTWQEMSLPALKSGKLTYTYFIDPNRGWLNMYDSNNNYYIYHTIDGGNSWTLQNEPKATPIGWSKMKFLNDTVGYALSAPFNVFKTINGGKLWEPLPRDNNFSYLNYSHYDLQVWSIDQLWAGGGHGFLELSNNGGGVSLPRAYFKFDTTGYYQSGLVQLLNFSKTDYKFKWYVNDILVSTSYNTLYTHDPLHMVDTVQLIASNGTTNDTIIQLHYFNPLVSITSYTPKIGATGSVITITGQNFTGATQVQFGDALAYSFTVISPTQIRAVVNNGASGNVTVFTPNGTGFATGFTYFPPPESNIPTSVSKSILCMAESIRVTLQNTEANVKYELVDSLNRSYGAAISSGGTIVISSSPISVSGHYKIRASRQNVASTVMFPNTIFILVEHTKSAFTANRVNVKANEAVNFYQSSTDAQTFAWRFNDGASINTSSLPYPTEISYTTPGQKSLSLVSISAYGCRDTLNTNAVFVFPQTISQGDCYLQNVDDSDYSYYPDSPSSINEVNLSSDNGYFISGKGNKPKLNSRFGASKIFTTDGLSYFAKYTSEGILSWYAAIEAKGEFYAAENDQKGNIYITGSCHVLSYLRLPNGDSLRVAATPGDLDFWSDKQNGFVIKLDAAGNYLWHTVIDDPSPINQGYSVKGGLPLKLKVENNQIILAGQFYANLAYYQNGIKQKLVSLAQYTNPNYMQNLFVMKIRSDGALAWYTYYINSATNQMYKIAGLGIDKYGNNYVLGGYEQSVILRDANGSTITINPNSYNYKSYLIKMDSMGVHKWLVKYTGEPRGFEVDSNGVSYATGSSSALQVINSDNSITNHKIVGYHLLKFSPDGINLWATGTEYSYYGYGNSLAVNGNNIITTGTVANNGALASSFTFTSTDGNHLTPQIYSSEFFIASYDTLGALKRIATSGKSSMGLNALKPNKILIDKDNNFIITGISGYTYNQNYDVFGSTMITNGIDGFFAKINASYCYASTPPIADAGPDKSICAGDTTSIGISGSNNSYYWTSQPVGFTSALPNPVVSPTINTTYFLTVINAAGIVARDTVIVSTISSPQANAGLDQVTCKGSQVTIGSSQTPNSSYNWTSSPLGFSSNQANPSAAPTTTTSYYLKVSNNYGCVSKDTVIVNVSDPAEPNVNIGGSSAFCAGYNASYNSTLTNGGTTPTYEWQVNGIDVGTNSNNFSSKDLVNGDQVRLIIISSANCITKQRDTSNSITVTVHPSVIPTVSITTPSEIICDGTNVSFTAIPVNGGSSPFYQWEVNGSHIASNTSNFSSMLLKNNDQVNVLMTSNATCPSSPTVKSNVVTMQVEAANAGLDKTICFGTSGTLIGSEGKSGNNYQWAPINGLSSGSVSQPNANPSTTTTYYLSVSTASGCVLKDTVLVNVLPIPSKPTITSKENLLTSSASIGNQWYKDGLTITNATEQTYTVTSNGVYTVRVSNGICTSQLSNPINFTITSINSPLLSKEFIIGPNPVINKLLLQYKAPRGSFKAQLYDLMGKKILTEKKFTNNCELNVKNFSRGAYIIKIVNEKTNEQIQRIIIKL